MKPSITVVSLGTGDPNLLTLQTEKALHKGRLVLRTGRHRCAAMLEQSGISYDTLDDMYDVYDDFDALYPAMAERLWTEAGKHALTYAVQDAMHDDSVEALRRMKPEEGSLTILPGLSVADICMAKLPADFSAAGGLTVMTAGDCLLYPIPQERNLLITEIDNRILAGDVKMLLEDLFGEEKQVCFFPSTAKMNRNPSAVALYEMDRQPAYDHTVAVFVPAAADPLRKERYAYNDLLRLMDRLRGEEGCPWDQEQTHETLRTYLLEEAWEVIDAINEGDPDHLSEELGDLLFQVAFHSSIAASSGEFTAQDVTTGIVRKMISRHSHIFGADDCRNAEEVSRNWEKRKMEEKGQDTVADAMHAVPSSFPSLMYAEKVQKKAARVGFDWDTAEEALSKVLEEAEEVRQELLNGRDPGEEIGDLLFSCVNVARLAGQAPEILLRAAADKFVKRFTAMEKLIISDGKSLKDLTLQEMDVYWSSVKRSPCLA